MCTIADLSPSCRFNPNGTAGTQPIILFYCLGPPFVVRLGIASQGRRGAGKPYGPGAAVIYTLELTRVPWTYPSLPTKSPKQSIQPTQVQNHHPGPSTTWWSSAVQQRRS